MCWGSVKRRKGLPSSSRYSLSPVDLGKLPTSSPYPLTSINSPSPSSSSCWSWVQCGASLGCISQEEQTFPRVGSVKFWDKTCKPKWLLMLQKKSKKESLIRKPMSKSGPRCSLQLHSAYIYAMQLVFRLFVCVLLGWIKICWALVSAYSTNFISKISKCVSDKEKNKWLWSFLPHARAMSPICCLSRTPAKYWNFHTEVQKMGAFRVILKFITLNDINIYETGKMLLGNINP